MSKVKQCPGPWTVTGNSWQHTTVHDADGYPVCRLDLEDWGVTEGSQDELEKLQATVATQIAAAPDLLEAAEMLEAAELGRGDCEECDGEGEPEACGICFPAFDDARIKRRLAIEKARGRPPTSTQSQKS